MIRSCVNCGGHVGRKSTSGLCRGCGNKARRANAKRIQDRPNEPRPCTRCGIRTRRPGFICRDCADVLSAEEIGRWVA